VSDSATAQTASIVDGWSHALTVSRPGAVASFVEEAASVQ
jgi:hypothetical protein